MRKEDTRKPLGTVPMLKENRRVRRGKIPMRKEIYAGQWKLLPCGGIFFDSRRRLFICVERCELGFIYGKGGRHVLHKPHRRHIRILYRSEFARELSFPESQSERL